ncbi:DNA-binding transcriptional regulator, LysR family [Selenomonas ruminantium]|uniref:DNA-binding transcriptional regulator, LysR family n=1 Tax=Selenomonas ruminantium TaxID=971 RepID=A0A1M6X1F0_SELRU|nr:LysR family transcriptional regulator [Selenomonas ruminantium]SHK99842.1 DNA-binding transcriptional regulator, LysR family [Selenomonas ruminantium]
MEFRQLEYFCEISKLRNFTRTAESLHVSQPSVTKAIKALEAELGLTLIDRSQKQVHLTEEGKAFLFHAQRIMKAANIALKDMEHYRRDKRETIHFGIPPMVEAYLFPDLFTEFKQVFTNVNFDVQEFSDSEEVRKRIDQGELDFGIVLGKPGNVAENELMIMLDSMSICLPAKHSLVNKKEILFSDLQNEKFIMQHPNTYQYREVYEHCRKAGFAPKITLCTAQIKTIKQLVANGMGISILPNFVTRTEKIFVRRPLKPDLKVQVSLNWGLCKGLSTVDTQFIEFIKAYAEHNFAS